MKSSLIAGAAAVISDAAYQQLQTAAAQKGLSKGVFGTALRLYQENCTTTLAAGNIPKAQVERLLLSSVNITSLLDQSVIEFKAEARKALFKERAVRSFKDAGWNIAVNILANIIFILLSILVYLSMQDTAQNTFRSLGVDVRPSIEQDGRAPDQKMLPAPDTSLGMGKIEARDKAPVAARKGGERNDDTIPGDRAAAGIAFLGAQVMPVRHYLN